MYKSFNTLDELFAYIKEDKEWTGANAGLHNRYPIRFVLFDNFTDFNEFIVERPDGIYKYSIDTMLDKDDPDQFLSYTELSREIRAFTKKVPINDFVIYPFSEMTRFYDNEIYTEFDSLVTTIRGQQAPEEAQNKHIRIYIPIVGMQGKMGKFFADNSTFVWELKSGIDKGIYNLILTNGSTYGVSGLSEKYTVVGDLYEWLKLWEKGDGVKQNIICSSPNIFANVHHAQPDNAFSYQVCNNVFQFLCDGLKIDFGNITEPDEIEMQYWEQLAKDIDVVSFNFDEYVKERLDTFSLNDGIDFIKTWFDCDSDFDRWLLTLYFKKVTSKEGYIYHAVSRCSNLSKAELFSNIATCIFEDNINEVFIEERRQAMKIASDKGVKITDFAKNKLKTKLNAIAKSPENGGYSKAVKLLTPLTDVEHQLSIEWVSKGYISRHDIKDIYNGLYYYLEPCAFNTLDISEQWIAKYIDMYKYSKMGNCIHPDVEKIIHEKNSDTLAFHNWYDNIKTVKTILHNRKDIELFYWIDGLGVDWIPFISSIITRYSKEHVYLNEVYIAAADLPTVTSVNKVKLQSLLPDNALLPKIGDLDEFAHSSKSYPDYIINEMKIVENAICEVLDNYNGKKIAFISDHGLTYLSQISSGLGLGGINSNHEGRLATYNTTIVDDNNYLKLEDNKTICSLTHQSLGDKVDKGHGAHGGCTPEEVLVPIIIVSSQKNANTYLVNLENDEIEGTKPIARFKIKGLSSVDVPSLVYNGVTYKLFSMGNDIFESERLNLVETATKLSICINNEIFESYNIKVSTGATEDDLFGEF